MASSSILAKNALLYLQFTLSFLLAASFSVAEEVVELEQVVGNSDQREFDYFVLALQWPATYCRFSKKCCRQNACCRGENSPTEFTIHGLWSNYNDGSWPSCCGGSNFNEKEVTTDPTWLVCRQFKSHELWIWYQNFCPEFWSPRHYNQGKFKPNGWRSRGASMGIEVSEDSFFAPLPIV
ncbi:unnamed protein product [Linum trigynum]|uniref:Uncharacterized protein n=1 Tax=Linum trigynum TaxID=586398 RepID=A0AAV2GB35_9ROSI